MSDDQDTARSAGPTHADPKATVPASPEHPAPYLPTGNPAVVESTPLARAGWYGDGQHGGVVAALLGRAIEAVSTLTEMEVARLTVELFRVVPVVPLRLETRLVREGKRLQMVEASAFDPAGLELARAVGLKLRTSDLDLPPTALTPPPAIPPPDEIEPPDMSGWGIGSDEVLFHRQAVEVREVGGGFDEIGPGAMWLRIRRPLVAGEELTPLTRAVVAGDFVNGLSRLVEAKNFVFMNADLTIHLHRPPIGEWVGVEAVSRYDRSGRGVATATLSDTTSEIGRSTQTLFIDRAAGS